MPRLAPPRGLSSTRGMTHSIKIPGKAEHILVTLGINLIKSQPAECLQSLFDVGIFLQVTLQQCPRVFGWAVSTQNCSAAAVGAQRTQSVLKFRLTSGWLSENTAERESKGSRGKPADMRHKKQRTQLKLSLWRILNQITLCWKNYCWGKRDLGIAGSNSNLL